MKKSLLALVVLIAAITFIVGFLDPFYLGVDYMGEGLPMAFGQLFCWIATLKLWTLYHVFFSYNKQTTNQQENLSIFIAMTLLINIVNIVVDPFHIGPIYDDNTYGEAGLNLFGISIIGTLLFFDLWVLYQYVFWRYKQSLKTYTKTTPFFRRNRAITLFSYFLNEP
ncbi:MAG: hypothetical protein GY810_20565 [Aureispira sp.]|nr:hypothetical protein [Aureispira sp.]